ncbi:DHA1 family chloramphenicol resistance protein-like MFS transporter [Rhodococcus sp. AG1013]|uniref:Cmx/CmrA family chloramphenicol efflux MFS transporter n=1 Tax=Rhodococcus sp. AG1013 TaxID=2183996 RepID=UPI000E09F770|nr:Cmx/CmrA family chloramphenicol efflux MFS transporter [Rhodococcus sp. AG1013]RDI32325.1 DHA1 family chloramphenicol resistance protein-like MFS transporter [Rhodococcus sp. AG1013]
MPTTVFVLGFAIFAQGTSELMLAGLVPDIAVDLGVSVPQAGLLISGFGLGMVIGAPVLTIATLRWPRRRALLLFIGVFVLAHVVGATSSSFEALFASRFIGAFVYAGFWAVAASTAMELVPGHRRGRAMSIVAGGLTVATVIGLPAGTWIGQNFGWRAAFWAVVVLSVPAMAGVAARVPALTPSESPRVRDELRAMARPRLWLSYAMTAASTAALLVTFSYLGVLLIDTTGLAPAWVPAVLSVYGVGALLGIAVGGRAFDRWPVRVLGVGFAGLLVCSALIALTAESVLPMVILVFLLGATGFGANPALNARVFGIAPAAPALVAAGSTASFNVGISVGPWLGGLALTAGFGYPSVGWIGAALALVALVLLEAETLALGRERRAPTSGTKALPIVVVR